MATPGLSIARDFVSQEQIDEAREKKKEEWEKAYASGETDQQAPPEEKYDPRTLYERIAANKQKKEDEFAEATRLSNLIHRIDEDEMDFLTSLEHFEADKRKQKASEESEELNEYRRAQAGLSAAPVSLPASTATVSTLNIRRKANLKNTLVSSGVILKKSKKTTASDNPSSNSGNESSEKIQDSSKRKLSDDSTTAASKISKGSDGVKTAVPQKPTASSKQPAKTTSTQPPKLSLVSYGDDSDSDSDSDSNKTS